MHNEMKFTDQRRKKFIDESYNSKTNKRFPLNRRGNTKDYQQQFFNKETSQFLSSNRSYQVEKLINYRPDWSLLFFRKTEQHL